MNSIQGLGRAPVGIRSTDPFMRKNQVWFRKALPPALEPQHKRQKPPKHIEQRALTLLNPKPLDYRQLTPHHYKARLQVIEQTLHRASNQLPESKPVLALLQQERLLMGQFFENRLTAVPC